MNINNKYEMTGSMNFLLAGNEVRIKAEGSNIDTSADAFIM